MYLRYYTITTFILARGEQEAFLSALSPRHDSGTHVFVALPFPSTLPHGKSESLVRRPAGLTARLVRLAFRPELPRRKRGREALGGT